MSLVLVGMISIIAHTNVVASIVCVFYLKIRNVHIQPLSPIRQPDASTIQATTFLESGFHVDTARVSFVGYPSI